MCADLEIETNSSVHCVIQQKFIISMSGFEEVGVVLAAFPTLPQPLFYRERTPPQEMFWLGSQQALYFGSFNLITHFFCGGLNLNERLRKHHRDYIWVSLAHSNISCVNEWRIELWYCGTYSESFPLVFSMRRSGYRKGRCSAKLVSGSFVAAACGLFNVWALHCAVCTQWQVECPQKSDALSSAIVQDGSLRSHDRKA
jgi:hypothetical protein